MIRILHYIGLLQPGGSQSLILEIYRKTDRTKVQFDFVVFSDTDETLKKEIESLGGKVFKSPQYNGKNHLLYKRWWNAFLDSHPEYRILHGHVRSVAAVYVPAAKRHGLITIVHSHSTSNGIGFQAKLKDLMQLPIRFQADYLFACSKEAGRWLFGKKACLSCRYRFIPNSIDIEKFTYCEKVREEVRSAYQLMGKKVIGNTGRLTEAKNQIFLLEMLYEIPDEDTVLMIVGDGSLADALHEKTEELGLENRVIFMGMVSNIEQLYQAMDIFVFPSLWEGFPVSVLEAQANGLKCLISDRVTSEAKLTERVRRLPLEKGAVYWAGQVIKGLDGKRTGARIEDLNKLKKFDSKYSAKKLQKFYLDCMRESALEEKK